MKLAFTTLACPDWDLRQIINAAVQYGYDAVDFRGYRREMHLWELPEFTDRADATADMICKAGLAISCFSSGAAMFDRDPRRRDRHVEEVACYGRLCRRFGVGLVPLPADQPQGPLAGIPVRTCPVAARTALESPAP